MAHPDLDALFDAVRPLAEQFLVKNGEFFPFGAAMAPNGEIAMLAASDGSEHPPSADLIALLNDGLRQRNRESNLKASAICFDSRVIPPESTTKTDAIAVRLEHQSGDAVDVFVPYKKGVFGKLKFGKVFAAQGPHNVFIDASYLDAASSAKHENADVDLAGRDDAGDA